MLISDMINEVSREINLRSNTFPRLIDNGRLSQGEATERAERLKAVLNFLTTTKNLRFNRPDEVEAVLRSYRGLTTNLDAVSTPIHIKGCE